MLHTYYISDAPPTSLHHNITAETARRLIDDARHETCHHPRAEKVRTLGCRACGVFLVGNVLTIDDAPDREAPKMEEATELQCKLIDERRTNECGHPPTLELRRLQFLSCHRCGSMFVNGSFRTIDVITEAQDRRLGLEHLSSYIAAEPTNESVIHISAQNLGILPPEDFDKICASIINKLANSTLLSTVEYKLAVTAINNLNEIEYEGVRETVIQHLKSPESSLSANSNAWIIFALGGLARTWYAKPRCQTCRQPLDADGYCRVDGCPHKNFVPPS